MKRHGSGIRSLAILAAIISSAAGITSAADVKLFNKPTPPTGADLKAMLAQVNEVFKTEIAAAKTPEQKLALAQKLHTAGKDEKDPPAKFVLLDRARSFAADAGDFELICNIVTDIEKDFDVAGAKLKVESATVAVRNLTSLEQATKFLKTCVAETATAVANDDFGSAKQFSALEISCAKLIGDNQIFKDALARVDQIKEAETASIEASRAATVLATKPEDPDSNLKYGRYLCFYKRNWEKGLPALALVNDPALKSAAGIDLKHSDAWEDKLKIGDAWWEIATPLKGLAKRNIQERAVFWYKQVVDGMEKSLAKTRLEKRIAEFAEIQAAATTIAAVSGKFREQDCVGVWVLGKGPSIITIFADHTATESRNKTVTGTWELVDGEIRVTYSNGYRNYIVPKDDKFVMQTYAPKSQPGDPPTATISAAKRAADTAPAPR